MAEQITNKSEETPNKTVQADLNSIDERLIALAINGVGCAKEVFKKIKNTSDIEGWENTEIFEATRDVYARHRPKPMLLDKLDVKEELKIRGTLSKISQEKLERVLYTVPERKKIHETIELITRRSLKKEMDSKLERLSSSNGESVEKIAIEIAELAKRKGANSTASLLGLDEIYHEIEHIEDMPECVKTGFPTLDERLGGGLVKGNYHVLCAPTGSGKALAVDTKIPTPNGFTTIKDVNIGDIVFDEEGNLCSVTNKSEVFTNKRCFELIFDTGEKIIASEDHLWTTLTTYDKEKISDKEAVSDWRNYWNNASTLTTLDMYNNKESASGRSRYAIPISKNISGIKYDGIVEPYLFGYWLGDGFSYNSMITVHLDDSEEFLKNIDTKRKVTINKSSNASSNAYFISMLKPDIIKEFGFITEGKNNKIIKRIPIKILRADYNTRLEVLRGLMDSDGYVVSGTNSVEITMKKTELINDVFELICSLGIKCYKHDKKFLFNNKDYVATILTFRPNVNVFKLKRKANKICKPCGQESRHTARIIKEINEIEIQETQCIMVNSPRNLFLIGDSFIPTHNSILTISLWKNMLDMGLRTVYINYEIPRSVFFKYLFAQFTGVNVMHNDRLDKELLAYKKEEFKKEVERLFDENLLMISDPMQGSSQMWNDVETMLRDVAEQSQPECIFFDTINSVYAKTNSASQGARWNEYEYISISAEHFTGETNIAMVFTAQPSQDVMGREDKTPMLYDVAGGKTISEKAASIIHLHRTDIFDPSRKIDYSELHVTKNRVMGQEMGSVPIKVKYNKDYKNLVELSRKQQAIPIGVIDTELPPHPIYGLNGAHL